MAITEIALLRLKPSSSPTPSQPSIPPQLDSPLSKISTQPGFLSQQIGPLLESPSTLALLIDWVDLKAHQEFMGSEGYGPFLREMGTVLDEGNGAVQMVHVDFEIGGGASTGDGDGEGGGRWDGILRGSGTGPIGRGDGNGHRSGDGSGDGDGSTHEPTKQAGVTEIAYFALEKDKAGPEERMKLEELVVRLGRVCVSGAARGEDKDKKDSLGGETKGGEEEEILPRASGFATGWILEDQEIDSTGVKTTNLTLVLGWDSRDAHMAAKQGRAFQEAIAPIRDMVVPGGKGRPPGGGMFHVDFSRA